MTDVATLLSIPNTMSAAETRLPQAGGEARSSPHPHDASASPAAAQDAPDGDSIMLLEPRPFRPFKTSEEYLYAMREDLAEWLKNLYQLEINVDNFFEILETGEVLCRHANNVRRLAEEQRQQGLHPEGPSAGGGRRFSSKWEIPQYDVVYRTDVAPGSFFARDNVHNFIAWCRDLGIYEVLLFETDDLVMRKNEKHVILSLLEVARRGARYGMAAPLLVQMEHDIDREMEKDRLAEERRENGGLCGGEFDHENGDWNDDGGDLEDETPQMFYGPQAQIITNDLKSLDEMVRDLVERCSCPSQFPMVKVSEGKYRIGDTRVLIFVRILRNHVMVRVGGGWDTLEHYLDKHDPCRCRQGHRTALSSRVGFKTSSSGQERQLMNVTYERSGGHAQVQTPTPRTQTQSREFADSKPTSRMTNSSSLSNRGLRERNSQRKFSQGTAALSATFNPLNKEQASTPHKVPKPVKNRLSRSQESLQNSLPKITPVRKRSVYIPKKLGIKSSHDATQLTNQQWHKGIRKTKDASRSRSASPAPQQGTKGSSEQANKTPLSSSSRIPQRKLGRVTRSGENRILSQHNPDSADISIEELKVNRVPTKTLTITSTPKPYKSLGILDVNSEIKEGIPVYDVKNNEPSKCSTKIPTLVHNKPSSTARDPSSTNDANRTRKMSLKTLNASFKPPKETQEISAKTGERRSTERMQSTAKRSPERIRLQNSLEQRAKASGMKASLIPTKCPAPVNTSVSATSTKT